MSCRCRLVVAIALLAASSAWGQFIVPSGSGFELTIGRARKNFGFNLSIGRGYGNPYFGSGYPGGYGFTQVQIIGPPPVLVPPPIVFVPPPDPVVVLRPAPIPADILNP